MHKYLGMICSSFCHNVGFAVNVLALAAAHQVSTCAVIPAYNNDNSNNNAFQLMMS